MTHTWSITAPRRLRRAWMDALQSLYNTAHPEVYTVIDLCGMAHRWTLTEQNIGLATMEIREVIEEWKRRGQAA